MRRLFALFLAGGCLFAAILFAMGAARAEKCADAVWQNPVLYLEKPISAEDAQNIAESAVFTAWGETADQTVTDPDLGKSVQTNVVWLYGSSEWILPSSAVLPEDDGKGCLIGENTAWKLFGSTNVTGLQICVDDQTRTIRGVVQQPENGVYLQGTEQKKKVFRRLTLAGDKMEGMCCVWIICATGKRCQNWFRAGGRIFPGGKKMFRRENNSCARLQKCAKQELNIITRHSAGDIKLTGVGHLSVWREVFL